MKANGSVQKNSQKTTGSKSANRRPLSGAALKAANEKQNKFDHDLARRGNQTQEHGKAFLEALREVVGNEESDATITIPLNIPVHVFDWVNIVALSHRFGWTEEEVIGELITRLLEALPGKLEKDEQFAESFRREELTRTVTN